MAEATPHSTAMNVDTIFGVLSNEYRRIILAQLLEKSPVPIEELIDSLAEAEASGNAPRDDVRNRVRASLHHIHLPKLAELDMIDFDTERGFISVGVAAYDVEPYLELAQRGDHGG